MSILDNVRRLIMGSETTQQATQNFIRALAEEAIKQGDPSALVAVAAQWESLQEGRELIAGPERMALPETAGAVPYTKPCEMRPIVVEIMQAAYIAGIFEITNGTIQKQLDAKINSQGGWKPADLEDLDPGPRIRVRWKQTLSTCLLEMRHAGDIVNDPSAYKTYRLAEHLYPRLAAAPESMALPEAEYEWHTVS